MDRLLYGLFLYFLLTIPVFLGLALAAQLGRSRRAGRASEVVFITGVAALIPVVLDRALEKPVLWPVVALLAAILLFGLVRQARSDTRAS